MRDAACERADAVQTLGAEELCLDFLLLADVGVDDKQAARLSSVIGNQRPSTLHRQHLFTTVSDTGVVMPFTLLQRDGFCALKVRPIAENERLCILPVNIEVLPAVKSLGSFVPVSAALGQVRHHDGVLGLVE